MSGCAGGVSLIHNLWGPILLIDKKTRFIAANEADNEGKLQKYGNLYIGYFFSEFNNVALRPPGTVAGKYAFWKVPTGKHKVKIRIIKNDGKSADAYIPVIFEVKKRETYKINAIIKDNEGIAWIENSNNQKVSKDASFQLRRYRITNCRYSCVKNYY